MKSYTDLHQSKILAEFLPKSSADMAYLKYASSDNLTFRFEGALPMVLGDIPIDEIDYETLPCWSLVALLKLIKPVNNNTYKLQGTLDGGAFITFDEVTNIMYQESEIIDVVYEMVLELHHKKLL